MLNNQFTNPEQELAKLEEFEKQLGQTETSFNYLYCRGWVPRFRRDNFTPENIEKLLLNVLLKGSLLEKEFKGNNSGSKNQFLYTADEKEIEEFGKKIEAKKLAHSKGEKHE